MARDKKKHNSIFNIEDEINFIHIPEEPGEKEGSAPEAGAKGGKKRSFGIGKKLRETSDKAVELDMEVLALPTRFSRISPNKKRIIGIIAMLIAVIICLYYLVFIPRTAETLFILGTSKLEGVDSYHAELEVHENRVMTSKEIKAIKNTGEKSALVPITWLKTIDKSGEVEHIKCDATFVFGEAKGEYSKDSYSDGLNQFALNNGKYELVMKEEGKRENFTLAELNLETLLHVSDETLENATFGSTWTGFTVSITGEEAKVMLCEMLAMDTSDVRFREGFITYEFSEFSKELESISVSGLELYQAGAKENSDPTSTVSLKLIVNNINGVKDEDVELPDIDVRDEIKSQDDSKLKAEKMTLSIADMKDKNISCYIVGRDIGEGKYTIKHKKGAGIVMGIDGKSGDKKFRYCSGYNYHKYDNMGDGKEVKLNEGDRVLLAGADIKLVFKPKK